MKENRLVKYESRELEKVGNSLAITSKLLAKNNDLSTLIINRTYGPNFNFNALTGIVRIGGRSIHDDPWKIYPIAFDWFDKYFINPKNNIKFKFQFEYVNADSVTIILDLLRYTIKKANDKGIKCSIDWYYKRDDEAMLELGEIYKKLIEAPFSLIQQNE